MPRKVVVFTGAGASKGFGYPLTNEILGITRDRLQSGELFLDYGTPYAFGREDPWPRQAQKKMRRYMNAIFPGLSKAKDGLPLITDLISMFDHALATSTSVMQGSTLAEHAEFRMLLEWATVDALLWPDDPEGKPGMLADITERLAGLADKGTEVALISTNYDTSIDDALFGRLASVAGEVDMRRLAEQIDFGAAWRDPYADRIYPRPTNPAMRVYKLHGSINMLRCDMCEHLYVNPYGKINHWAFYPHRIKHNTCWCGHFPLRSSIVAPSQTRGGYTLSQQMIWKAALDFLGRANAWYILGYGLPSEDVAIRTLFAKAYQNAAASPKVVVVLLKQDGEARYRVHFPDLEFHSGGMKEFSFTRIR